MNEPKMMDLTDRDLLAQIELAAKHHAETVTHPAWKRVYFRLADAVDCLDAFVARCGDKVPTGEVLVQLDKGDDVI